MKLLAFGSSGGTGRQVVAQALDAGHHVTAVAREPGRVTMHHPKLTITDGDTTAGSAALTGRMRGHDAVISAIGRGKTFKSDRLIQRSVPCILDRLNDQGAIGKTLILAN